MALNQAILVAVLGSVLLIPRMLIMPMETKILDNWMAAALAMLVAVFCMALNMRRASIGPDKANEPWKWIKEVPDRVYESSFILLYGVGYLFLAVYVGSIWVWHHIDGLSGNPLRVGSIAFGTAAFLSVVLSVVGGFVRQYQLRLSHPGWWPGVLALVTILCAGTSVGLFRVYLLILSRMHASPAGSWHAAIWAPVLLLAVLIVPGTLQVGLMGVDFPDAGREWLSRFRAICSLYATYWIALMAAAIYAPLLILRVTLWSTRGLKVWISGLTLGWVITTIGGLVAGKSKVTGRDKEGNPTLTWAQTLAKLASPVFIVGLILLIATAEQILLSHGIVRSYSLADLTDPGNYWKALDPWPLLGHNGWYIDRPLLLLISLGIVGAILAWRVDINEFSMHHFYKNRLVRCYLGASRNDRKPNPFTGFDGGDDFPLSALRAIPLKKQPPAGANPARNPADVEKPYLGPYPIVNTTLNLSVGKQLAWQERKGTSFIFTPCYCGFDVAGWANTTMDKSTVPRGQGYRSTEKYTHTDGPNFGTSMSISGAAANPNQGYNTSPAVSFLMTMFNVRLGWWLGNPRFEKPSKTTSPSFGLAALLSELVGSTDDDTKFVNLSDGGHFDNMGLYELVRRRCSFILLCDAEQDHEYKFEGLGSAIRKCRIDFGAIIDIDPSSIKPAEGKTTSEKHCAVGDISYLDGSRGTLVYIKSSLTGDEPEDVLQYHCAHPHFPHESTADQWFGESQFESYRALGYHAVDQSFSTVTGWLKWAPEEPKVADLFEALEKDFHPLNPNLKDAASKHTATLTVLLERLRKHPALHQLGAELFPGSRVVPPVAAPMPRNPAEEFFFSMCVLQLVEDIYFDFQLYRKRWFEDPRIGGWRELFRTWKRVPAIAAAWDKEQKSFREDFQLFWKKL